MNPSWLKRPASWLLRYKLLSLVLCLLIVFCTFAVIEHLRGHIMVARYLRSLKAQGEKFTAQELQKASIT